MPFSVIPRLDRGIQKVFQNTGSPGQPFDNAQGHESLDVALDHELVEWRGEWAGGCGYDNFCNILLRSLYDDDL